MNLVREIESACGQQFQIPFPTPLNTGQGPLAIPKDIWTLNFYCSICRKVERIEKQRLVWIDESKTPKAPAHLNEVVFLLAFQCAQKGCKSQITLHVLGSANDTAGDVKRRHENLGLRVSCSKGHQPTELKSDAIPIKEQSLRGNPSINKFIEFFRCAHCNKAYRLPFSMRPLLGHILPSLSTGNRPVL
jgi:hypothetical protein